MTGDQTQFPKQSAHSSVFSIVVINIITKHLLREREGLFDFQVVDNHSYHHDKSICKK